MTDIKLENGELTFDYQDIAIITEEECLLQDIRNQLYTEKGALFYDEFYGSGLLNFIHRNVDLACLSELKQVVKVIIANDSRVDENSIVIETTTIDNGVKISVVFSTVNGQKLTFGEFIPMRV